MIFGGQVDCVHEWQDKIHSDKRGLDGSTLTGTPPGQERRQNYSEGFCSLCGAWRGQFGLEPTPDLFIEHLVDLFTHLRPKLRKDGTLFVNLGDSYLGNNSRASNGGRAGFGTPREGNFNNVGDGKPKDLALIPFRFALAMQAAGWWVRNVIIWSKPNPMPESVTDRCTTAHEYIFFFTRSAKYWCDMDAVRESANEHKGKVLDNRESGTGKARGMGGQGDRQGNFESFGDCERNLRSVWQFPTQPYPEAHFATYPEKLPETCILMGCPEKVCAVCGKPWERRVQPTMVVERGGTYDGKQQDQDPQFSHKRLQMGVKACREAGLPHDQATIPKQDLGIFPTCTCNGATDSGIVLDPFIGSGCTGAVAKRLKRHYIGFELKPEYVELARRRIAQTQEPMW